MYRPGRITFLTLAVLLSSIGSNVWAFPPNNLTEALQNSTDRENRRVPLLVLNAEKTEIGWENGDGRSLLNQLYQEQNAKPLLTDVLPAFRCQLVSCGSVQIVAPRNRIVVNPYPGPPEEWARIGRERAARLLFTSLSPAQWGIVSSTGGIGIADLNKTEQKAWFLSLIPNPFVLQQVQRSQSGQGYYSNSNLEGEGSRFTVSPEQVRLRIVRTMTWYYRSIGQNGYYRFGSGIDDNHRPGERYWTPLGQPAGQETPGSYRDHLAEVVRLEEPNRLQKGDLSFNTAPLFGKSVRFGGVKTLGELVQRIAEATGLELYADRRLTGLSLKVVGPEETTADAADITKALCYAIAGTVRQVTDASSGDSVYLLSRDKEGMMLPRLHLAEWASDVDVLLNSEQQAFEKTTVTGGYLRGIGFSTDTIARLDDSAMQNVEERFRDPQQYQNDSGFPRVPISALTPEAQAKVRQDLANNRSESDTRQAPLDEKNVYTQFAVNTQLIVPDHGIFPGPELTQLSSLIPRKTPVVAVNKQPEPPERITLPPTLSRFATLKVALKDSAEVDKVAKWANQHGFQALFIRTSLWDDTESERMARATTIAAKYQVKVYPVVSLLSVPPFAEAAKDLPPNNLQRATNIFGETLRQYAYRRKDSPTFATNDYLRSSVKGLYDSDWLEGSNDTVRKTVASRLSVFAKIPGIAGLVWENIAAPGTALKENDYTNGTMIGTYAGYTEALRIALIRQQNMDPLDLPSSNYLPPYISLPQEGWIPPFGNEWELTERLNQNPIYRKDKQTGKWSAEKASSTQTVTAEASWNLLRYESNRAWVSAIRREANLPTTLPIYTAAPSQALYGNRSSWVALWEATEPLLPLDSTNNRLLNYVLQPDSTAETVRHALGSSTFQKRVMVKPFPYAGITIDLTGHSLDKSLELLSSLATVTK